MRAQPSRRSSTAAGSPRRSSVTRSAWSLGSARTAATSTEQSTSTRAESRAQTLGPAGFSQVPGTVARTRLVLPSNICSLRLAGMQLRLDSADRLVELVEERRGPVFAEEAARRLFAIRHAPVGLARSLLDEVVGEDARLAWCGDAVGLADPPGADIQLEDATFVVVDTVGLARRLLSGRTPRAGLAMLAQFFGTEARPCHRALPDAQ